MAAIERNILTSDFDIKYSLLSDELEIEQKQCVFNFRTTFLYKYMSGVFQFVEENLNYYKNANHYYWCKVFQSISIIIMWLCVAFKFFQLFNKEFSVLKYDNMFQVLLKMANYLVWMIRYLILHHFGLLAFHRIPLLALELIENLKNLAKDEEDSNRINTKLKRKEKKINKVIGFTFVCIFLLRSLNRLVPIVVDEIQKSGSSKFKFWEDSLDFLVMIYTRVASLPFLYYLIFITYLQCFELKEFQKILPTTLNSADDVFNDYIKIHSKINSTAKKVHLYLSMSIGTIVIWGLLAVYTFMKNVSMVSRGTSNEVSVIFMILFDFLSHAVEVIYLFLLQWSQLVSVSKNQTKIIQSVLAIRCSQTNEGSPFNSVAEVLKFSQRLEIFQKYAGTGYKVFGVDMKNVNTVWFFILAPIGLLLANSAIKGDINSKCC